jgi:hypothetical protein
MPPLPSITPEQRRDALEKARVVRKARGDLRESLRKGTLTMTGVLDQADGDVAGKIKVSALLTSMPGVGKVRAKQIMERLAIADGRRVRGLGANQRAALLEEFGDDLATTA